MSSTTCRRQETCLLYTSYLWVNDNTRSWSGAYNEAKSYILGGRKGYLATAINVDEMWYMSNVSTNSSWVGGTVLVNVDAVSYTHLEDRNKQYPNNTPLLYEDVTEIDNRIRNCCNN